MLHIIRQQWEKFPELKQSHHFLYDLSVRVGSKSTVLLMGLNPGESDYDWEQWPEGQEEESCERDFHEGNLSPSSNRWNTRIDFFIPEGFPVVLTQMFFWSSKNEKQLRQRIGNWRKHPVLDLCVRANVDLIRNRNVKHVIFTGLSFTEEVRKLYDLELVTEHRSEGVRIAYELTDGCRTWLITKHWTGAYGFSARQRADLAKIIKSALLKN